MSKPTNVEYAAGLRELADFLEAHPEMPTPPWRFEINYGTDTEGELEQIAEVCGTPMVTDEDTQHRTVDRMFGRVWLHCSWVPAEVLRRFVELTSYDANLRAGRSGTEAQVSGAER